MSKTSRSSESGNVIFFIFIGVALFAALSMAISAANKGGGDITDEKRKVVATEIIEYSTNVATAVSRLRLNGCHETEISFENNELSGYENALAPSDESCHVFSLNGGGVRYQPYDMSITGSYVIAQIGSDETDLIMDLRTTKSTCEAINELLSIPNNGPEGPPTDKLSAGELFDGDYTIASTSSANQRTENAEFLGKSAGCRTNSGSGSTAIYYYYKVLMSR